MALCMKYLGTIKNLSNEKIRRITLAAQKEDNDLTSLGLMCKALREKRSEKFLEDWLPVLKEIYPIVENNSKYTITTQDYGVLDYFPKANKILIRQKNKWIKPGLKWIITNLIKM